MNDRELLELAAKAAGIEGKYGYAPDDYYYNGNVEGICTELPDGRSYVWNPLSDDGDALRLAIKLKITIQFPWDHKCKLMQETRCWNDSDDPAIEEHKDDPYAATRRAIVRAAAEIGRQMQEGGAA